MKSLKPNNNHQNNQKVGSPSSFPPHATCSSNQKDNIRSSSSPSPSFSTTISTTWFVGSRSHANSCCQSSVNTCCENPACGLRFHSYNPKEEIERKRKLKEDSMKNNFKGLHFKPSKYMLGDEKPVVAVDALHMHGGKKLSPNMMSLSNTCMPCPQFSYCKANETTTCTNNYIPVVYCRSKVKKQQPAAATTKLLPSIGEVLSRIEKPTHKMITGCNSSHNKQLFVFNSEISSVENSILAPLKLSCK